MRRKIISWVLSWGFLLGFMAGCASIFEQYLPTELKGTPNEELVELIFDQTIWYPKVDGVPITAKSRVYLHPGRHIVSHRVKVETEEWRSLVQKMEAEGYVLGKYVPDEDVRLPKVIDELTPKSLRNWHVGRALRVMVESGVRLN